MDSSRIGADEDLILFNGKIVTVDSNDTIVEAIAIRDGKIIGVGSCADVKSLIGPETKSIDLEGKTVVPGFIDAHVHIDCTATHTKLATSLHIPRRVQRDEQYGEIAGRYHTGLERKGSANTQRGVDHCSGPVQPGN